MSEGRWHGDFTYFGTMEEIKKETAKGNVLDGSVAIVSDTLQRGDYIYDQWIFNDLNPKPVQGDNADVFIILPEHRRGRVRFNNPGWDIKFEVVYEAAGEGSKNNPMMVKEKI
jgi:hypothetical protein